MNFVFEWTMLLLLLALSPVLARDPHAKIVGGWEADIKDVPYFVRVEKDSHNSLMKGVDVNSRCGATIIHP